MLPVLASSEYWKTLLLTTHPPFSFTICAMVSIAVFRIDNNDAHIGRAYDKPLLDPVSCVTIAVSLKLASSRKPISAALSSTAYFHFYHFRGQPRERRQPGPSTFPPLFHRPNLQTAPAAAGKSSLVLCSSSYSLRSLSASQRFSLSALMPLR